VSPPRNRDQPDGGQGPALVVRRAARWGECDPAGIVYTPRFLDWVIEAVEAFFATVLQVPWLDLRRSHGLASPMARVSLDFKRPVAAGDEIDVELVVARIGRTSLTFAITGRRRSEPCFTAEVTTVFVDMASDTPTRVPDLLRDRAARFHAGQTSEQARQEPGGEP
jgi:YbgC/YbaW family acyl-CoA thioester hydrolase